MFQETAQADLEVETYLTLLIVFPRSQGVPPQNDTQTFRIGKIAPRPGSVVWSAETKCALTNLFSILHL